MSESTPATLWPASRPVSRYAVPDLAAVPDDVRRAMHEMGLALIGVPEELGGIAEERSAVTGVLVLEQLARGDMGIAVAQMATASVATWLPKPEI